MINLEPMIKEVEKEFEDLSNEKEKLEKTIEIITERLVYIKGKHDMLLIVKSELDAKADEIKETFLKAQAEYEKNNKKNKKGTEE